MTSAASSLSSERLTHGTIRALIVRAREWSHYQHNKWSHYQSPQRARSFRFRLSASPTKSIQETECKIQEGLNRLMTGRTTFIVAQRISSVLNADQIIVLDAGRIAAQGTHQELLKTSPIYQEIYRSQLDNGNMVDLEATGD